MIRKMSMLLASASLAAGMAAAPVRADEKAAAAVVALGILGIAAMAHHDDHYREGQKPQTAEEIADFERGYRDGLHNEPYDSRHSTAAYGNGFDAGHKERANQLAYKHQGGGEGPEPGDAGLRRETSAQWGHNPQDIHVVASRKAASPRPADRNTRSRSRPGTSTAIATSTGKALCSNSTKGSSDATQFAPAVEWSSGAARARPIARGRLVPVSLPCAVGHRGLTSSDLVDGCTTALSRRAAIPVSPGVGSPPNARRSRTLAVPGRFPHDSAPTM
ncbi:MAG: hypothetical protein R3D59_01655 [Paracoccaceae bacterium]